MTVTAAAAPRLASAPRGFASAIEFLRYFAASACALGVDMGVYAGALKLGMPYAFAALLGFIGGAVTAYLASVWWVFESRSVRNSTHEFALFMAVGIGGLLLTEALLWVAIDRFGFPPLLSKLATSAFVFVFNFGLRKALLFRAGH